MYKVVVDVPPTASVFGNIRVRLYSLEPGNAYIAFHEADTVEGAFLGALSKVQGQSIKWREDQYTEVDAEGKVVRPQS